MTVAPTTTPETILEEDGADAALESLAAEVRESEDAIRRVLAAEPKRQFTIRELQDTAAEGRRPTVMSIALMGLLRAGEVGVDHSSSIVRAIA